MFSIFCDLKIWKPSITKCEIAVIWAIKEVKVEIHCIKCINLKNDASKIYIGVQLHSTKPELRFCTGSNPAGGVSKMVRISDSGPGWK